MNALTYTGDKGFSLLELLVAIAILALLAFPLADSVVRGVKSWEATQAVSNLHERSALRRQKLAQWLRTAYTANPGRSTGGMNGSFSGSKSTIRFIAPLHPDPLLNTLYVSDLKFEVVAEKGRILLEVWEDFAGDEAEKTATTFLDNVSDTNFSFLPEGGKIWLDEWQGREDVPSAIKISVTFSDEAAPWPDLVVGLQTKEWAHCAYDKESLFCRHIEVVE